MKYLCDKHRHLICDPYSTENLHLMAQELDIKRCWFHAKPYPHYDIPKLRMDEISARCELVSPKEIIRVIRTNIG